MSDACWCGKAPQWFEYPHQGTTIPLCAEHKPQFEIKVVKPADYGPVRRNVEKQRSGVKRGI